MIRDTFEANPGLCELFKRKILERARYSGVREDLIDFQSQIDMKGSYRDNLRIFYREYPQLAQGSDYVRLKPHRPLAGAALEQSWRSYERNARSWLLAAREERPEGCLSTAAITPEFTITYTVGNGPGTCQGGGGKEHSTSSITERPLSLQLGQMPQTHAEVSKLLLGRIAAVAGDRVTKTILHQVGREIGLTAFHNSHSNQSSPEAHVHSFERALRILGFGKVVGLEEIDRGSGVTYECTIEECIFCHGQLAAGSTCDIMRGVVTCWLESLLKKRAERINAGCVNDRSHLCLFRVTFTN